MNNKIDYNDLTYVIASSSKKFDFGSTKDPIILLNDIKKGKISLEEAKNKQQNAIGRGNKNYNKKNLSKY